MKLPDGSVLMHGTTPYDPRKAHEYYLRNRELKGRKKGTQKPTMGLKSAAKPTMGVKKAPATYSVTVRGRTANLSAQQLKEQKAYAAKRVASIKTKLDKLNAELKKRMAAAKEKARESEKEAKKPDSAAEKAQSARDAAKYRDKNQQKIANQRKKAASEEKASASDSKPGSDKSDGIEELKAAIAGVQKSLAAAVDKQRALSSATKNG